MKTKSELEQAILLNTMKIQKEFPELSKYLIEIPVKFIDTDKNGINSNSLEDYNDSLNELLIRFSQAH